VEQVKRRDNEGGREVGLWDFALVGLDQELVEQPVGGFEFEDARRGGEKTAAREKAEGRESAKGESAGSEPSMAAGWRGVGTSFWNRMRAKGRAVRLAARDSARRNLRTKNNQPKGHSLVS
jgi:hypothetical protein